MPEAQRQRLRGVRAPRRRVVIAGGGVVELRQATLAGADPARRVALLEDGGEGAYLPRLPERLRHAGIPRVRRPPLPRH
jgi:hypothetical protein